jgi:hypothetical protein
MTLVAAAAAAVFSSVRRVIIGISSCKVDAARIAAFERRRPS